MPRAYGRPIPLIPSLWGVAMTPSSYDGYADSANDNQLDRLPKHRSCSVGSRSALADLRRMYKICKIALHADVISANVTAG